MSFAPVLPWAWLVAVGIVLLLLRVLALYSNRAAGGGRNILRWGGLTAAVLLFLVAAARPSIDLDRDTSVALDTPTSAGGDLNVFFVVDRSVTAPVAEMRADLTALIDEYSGARFSLISFATRATMDWPLSDDAWSLQSVMSGLSPYVTDRPDAELQVNAFAARDVLRTKTDEATQQYPGTRNLVYYLGAGAPGSVVSRGGFEVLPTTFAGGAVLGYGAPDAATLTEIADQLGVPYLTRGADRPAIAEVLPPIDESGGSGPSLQVAQRIELYWIFTSLVVLLVLVEATLTLREYRRTRMSRREVRP